MTRSAPSITSSCHGRVPSDTFVMHPLQRSNNQIAQECKNIGLIFSALRQVLIGSDRFAHSCKHKAFTRWYDLRRHYAGTHSNDGPAFWCHVDGCERSEIQGGRAFPRKDKLSDHVRKAHRGDERVLEIEMLRTRRI
jgi:hypothetical protein